MSGTVILCSGQGRQGTGMFDLLAHAPGSDALFAIAATLLDGRDPRDLARDGSAADLAANKVGQVLCCLQALLAWAALADAVASPIVVAGYSVGELASWGIAGPFDAATVLQLTAARAAAMDAATDAPAGLAAIGGLRRADLEAVCARHGAFVAIVNGVDRMIVGGARAALARVIDDAKTQGADRTSLLSVPVASHTPLLQNASEAFASLLARTPIGAIAPNIRLLSGIDGAPVFDLDEGRGKLAEQIRRPIDWQACMDSCRACGATRALELGPGDALARMMREHTSDLAVHALADFRSLDGVKAWLTRDG